MNAPHRIVNVFHMPGKSACELLGEELLEAGHDLLGDAVPQPIRGREYWVLESLRIIKPQLESIDQLTDWCVEVAQKFGGLYDGWYTEVIPK